MRNKKEQAADYSTMNTIQNMEIEREILFNKTKAEVRDWMENKMFSTYKGAAVSYDEITHRPKTYFHPKMKRRVFMDATLEKCCMGGVVECGEQLDKFETPAIVMVEGQRTETMEEHESYLCPTCLRVFEYNEVEVIDPFYHDYTRYNKKAAIEDIEWVFGYDELGNPRFVEEDTDPRVHVKYNTIIEGALMADDPNDDTQVHRVIANEEGTRMDKVAWKAFKDLPFWIRSGNGVKHIYKNRRLFEAEGMDISGLLDLARIMSKGKKDGSRKTGGWGMIRYAISKAKGVDGNAEMDERYTKWLERIVNEYDRKQGMERIKSAKAKAKGIVHAYPEWYATATPEMPEIFVSIENSTKRTGHKVLVIKGSLIENNMRKSFTILKSDWATNSLVYSDMNHDMVLKAARALVAADPKLTAMCKNFK